MYRMLIRKEEKKKEPGVQQATSQLTKSAERKFNSPSTYQHVCLFGHSIMLQLYQLKGKRYFLLSFGIIVPSTTHQDMSMHSGTSLHHVGSLTFKFTDCHVGEIVLIEAMSSSE